MAVWMCRRCGYSQDSPWEESCPGCKGLYRARKIGADTVEQKARRSTFAQSVESTVEHVPTGVQGLDHTLSGGLVAGDVVLFGGFAGMGKSTLLVTAMNALSHRRKTGYASSEQSVAGVSTIARRVGATSDNVLVLGDQKVVEDTIEELRRERVFCAVFDSLQKYVSRTSSSAPGTAAQGMAVQTAIKEDCRARGSCAIIVNQMTSSGMLKGGTDVEHDVDTVLVLAPPKDDDEDAPGSDVCVLVVEKNRNGSATVKSYWRMTEAGVLEHVSQRTKIIDLGAARRYRRD